ncbi:hypothetical protein V2J09_013485, partial [Rumex salicifolius]
PANNPELPKKTLHTTPPKTKSTQGRRAPLYIEQFCSEDDDDSDESNDEDGESIEDKVLGCESSSSSDFAFSGREDEDDDLFEKNVDPTTSESMGGFGSTPSTSGQAPQSTPLVQGGSQGGNEGVSASHVGSQAGSNVSQGVFSQSDMANGRGRKTYHPTRPLRQKILTLVKKMQEALRRSPRKHGQGSSQTTTPSSFMAPSSLRRSSRK